MSYPILNWEHGTKPELRHMPKIIEFLGYVPFECPDDPIGKLRYFKLVNGLSYERLGKVMGRDHRCEPYGAYLSI